MDGRLDHRLQPVSVDGHYRSTHLWPYLTDRCAGWWSARPGYFRHRVLLALAARCPAGDDFPLVESSDEQPQPAPRQDPVETLRDRYARGEIDQAEFERRLDYLVETEDLGFDVEDELGRLESDQNTRAREIERER
ncbi:SHOCT domain-containing protein [Halovenus salina]|uniref:SHOCT domain-containing protein n=1 Tax=Halovenus salina TaxID=1510225 RepID=A0ABD5W4R8_9EURY